jgi:hypothetical protein
MFMLRLRSDTSYAITSMTRFSASAKAAVMLMRWSTTMVKAS